VAKNNRGFTLIEVIAVLIIIGIITAIAVSRDLSTDKELYSQADMVQMHLRFAHLKALQDDTATWGIAFSGNSYALNKNNGATTIHLPSESSSSHSFPAGITITNTTVIFDKWGIPVDSLGNPVADIELTLSQSGSTPISILVTANTGFIP
jgi:prepilin-type N-terminal cleavage/methylation domain-containing protein